ncbi:MAG: class I SAM-dependent methyltransferase [Patescibacteria group bacterium]|jgi:16S rRNA G966 N2-methylase RsmD|nr:class I SAM-dependent methyltransferase [Patescibacteria group bacterium]
MDINNIQFLQTKEGKKVLTEMSELSWNKRHKYLFSTKEKVRRSHISAASALLESREKAEGKFTKNKEMFFSSLGLGQSTSEEIAIHISSRFHKDWVVADLACGIGANSIFLAKKCKAVFAIEKDEAIISCAKINSKVYQEDNKIKFLNTSAEEFIISKDFSAVDAVFIDPDRNRENNTKTRSILNSEPKILEILPEIFKQTKNVAIKISPAFDWKEIELLPEEPEIEVISEKNNCKMAILWFGDLKKDKRSATCFRDNKVYNFSSSDIYEKASIDTKPNNYIFELDKAITRAKLSDSFANYNNFKKIDINGRYLSLEKKISGPGRLLKIILAKKISLRKLDKELKKLEIDRAEIIAKNFFLKPEKIRDKLKLKDGGEFVIYVIEITKNDNLMLVAKKI